VDWPLSKFLDSNTNEMSTKEKTSGKIIVHGTSQGKLYIKEKEFFNNSNVRSILAKLINSTTVKAIKHTSI
jgi:hypothetical protein